MFEKIKSAWGEIIEYIRSELELSPVSFNAWLLPLKLHELTCDADGNNILVIIVPDDTCRTFVKKRYSRVICITIEEKTGIQCDLELVLEAELEAKKRSSENKGLIKDARGYSDVTGTPAYAQSNLNPKNTFSTFVVGSSNNIAHAACLAAAENPGEIYNPLFIYGNSGLGKTHLMQAVAHFVLEKDPGAKVLYVSSETFTNELVESIQRGTTNEFKNKYRTNDILLIDDIQFIIGKDKTQEEIFYTFEAMYEAKKQIIITSDRPPKELKTLEDRLRSRFEWGLTVDIQPPDYETRVAILRKKEDLEGINIDDAIIKYIASNIKGNIRELEGALTKVVAMGKLLDMKEVTLETAKNALRDTIDPNKVVVITLDSILQVVCDHFSVSREDIISSKRNKELVHPRHIAMYLMRAMTDQPLDKIGEFLGGRDHTTVIHGLTKISSELDVDNELGNTIDILKKKISPH
jgi:chromosomal replication initiator protein